MSSAVSALGDEMREGVVAVADAGQCGMVTLRGDLASAGLAAALRSAAGVGVPAPRRIAMNGAKGAAWMSPDELLLLCPYAEAAAMVAAFEDALL